MAAYVACMFPMCAGFLVYYLEFPLSRIYPIYLLTEKYRDENINKKIFL